jgi:hypothetical protein
VCLVKFINVPKGTEQLVIQNVWFQFMETKVASSNKFQERGWNLMNSFLMIKKDNSCDSAVHP